MRVIIAGGGVIGLASARCLADDGHSVTVVDAGDAGAATSTHNAGWIVPSMAVPVTAPGMLGTAMRWLTRPDSPLYIRLSTDPHLPFFLARMLSESRSRPYARGIARLSALAEDALSLYDGLRDDGLDFEQHDSPLTTLFTNQRHADTHAADLTAISAVAAVPKWEMHDRAQLRTLVPGVSDSVVCGLTTYGERSVAPASLIAALRASCERRGVEIIEHSPARLQKSDRGLRLATRERNFAADAFVVAAGVWTNEVIRPLGVHIPLIAGKGYGFDLPPIELPGPLYLSEGKVAVTPLNDRLRLAGTMGFGSNDLGVDLRRAGGILSSAREYLDGYEIDTTSVTAWTGLRPMTPDGIPRIGRLRRHPRVIIATGHQMLGITLAPRTALDVRRLIGDIGASGAN